MRGRFSGLTSELEAIGLELRHALDVASVVTGARPRGLLHVDDRKRHLALNMITRWELVAELVRPLYRTRDKDTRESLLSDQIMSGTDAEQWSEIWFRKADAPAAPHESLVRNPGLHLGYPPCCVHSMSGKASIAPHYASYILNNASCRLWEINRLATLFSKLIFMPDFFPCSLSCAPAEYFARPFRSLACHVWTEAENRAAISSATQPLILWQKHLVSFPEYSVYRDKITVGTEHALKIDLTEIGIRREFRQPRLLQFRHLTELLQAEQMTLEAVDRKGVRLNVPILWA